MWRVLGILVLVLIGLMIIGAVLKALMWVLVVGAIVAVGAAIYAAVGNSGGPKALR